MTTVEWLSEITDIKTEIETIAEEKKTALKTILQTSNIKPCKHISKAVKAKHRAVFDYINILDNHIQHLQQSRKEILLAIRNVKNITFRRLLFARYVKGYTWERIAELINMSDIKWVRTSIHTKALKAVENSIKSNVIQEKY